ncbi:MAG: TIGR02391 family protein [Candidatus Dormibacteria bacterium]
MDVAWALNELRSFDGATMLVDPPTTAGVVLVGDFRRTSAPESMVVARAQVVEQILDRVLPGWRSSIPVDVTGRWQQQRQAAQRAIVQLERQAEIDDKLGDNAPRMNAANLHPWAWEGARSLWQSGHLREAVLAAAIKLNAETQNKLGVRDVSEAALFQMAFSKDAPASGRPRLRLPEDDGGRTALSMRRGVMAFAEGCYAALRNPPSHDPQDELSEQEALEQLASFSVLARWVSRAKVEAA